jgi:hypothetical protein
MQNMSPEDRQRMMRRLRETGFDSSAARGRSGDPDTAAAAPGRGRGSGRGAAPPPTIASRNAGATTIDALFGPLPRVETTGRVWLFADKQLKPVRLRLGVSDGQVTELIEGNLQEGTEVITNITIGGETRPAAGGGGFPFGQPGRGGFPGGGGGNRGGGRGR